jgi:hypothetical protein
MNSPVTEEEVTKAAFKELYFQYATPHSGWTEDYWNRFYENEEGKKYYFSRPETPSSSKMFIITDSAKHCMVFLTEDAEESFFDFPGKE